MAIWDRLKVREEAKSNIKLEEITPPVDDVLLKALLGSEPITREKALTLPAVAGAVDFISNAVACMPVKLYQEKDGKVEEVKDDNRTKLLNGDTGDTLDAYQMKKAMVTDYLMGKGGYCYIRKSRNEVTGLFYVKDIYVSILREFEPVIKKDYQLLVEGNTYRPYEFVKILRNTKDGAEGIGLTEEISKELETAYQTLLYQLGMVRSGGNKRGFLKADRKLGQEEIDVLKTAWKNMYGNNTESVVVLNNGLQFQEASNSSVEMQMNESKRTMSDEIYDLFHIYPNDFDRTFKEAIYPIVKAFETALNRDLLLEKEKKTHFFEFDVKEIIKASLNERYSAYKTAKETGFMTLNEIRRAENLNWIDGLDVVNVGLGAVLYDVEEKKYFTPNTGEATDIESATQKKTEAMIEAHEEVEAFDESGNSAERELRFNPNHAKDGKFTTGNGGSDFKQAQFDIIQKTNPMRDDYHVGIRKVEDIKTAREAFETQVDEDEDYVYPDFSPADGKKALETGKITIYSSKPIQNGGFVATSKMMAQDYAGNGKVYSQTVSVDDVAWINSGEGQFAQIGLAKEKHRFNENHDPKTGRFAPKGGGVGSSETKYQQADENTQKKHTQAIEKLMSSEYESGTYDLETLKQVEYNKGYQVTFSQIGDRYSDKEYANKVNEFLSASSDGKASAGKFEGTPEVSFHVGDRKVAEELGRKYNQISIWDWEKGDEISTGGTGRRE